MATYYFRNVTGNWNLAANWSLTSGGGSTGAVPGVADTAILDSNSGNCTVTGASNCLNLTISGYTNTLTMNNTITLATTGTFTLGTTTVTVSGASAIILNGNNTMTSGVGGHYDGLISFSALGGVKTLSSNFSVKSITVTSNTTLTGSFNLICSGGTFTTTAILVAGVNVPTIVLIGTSTITGTGNLGGNLTFSGTGTITVSGTITKNGNTISYLSTPTVITTGSTLVIVNSTTIGTSAMTWNNVSFTTNTQTISLSQNFSCSGNVTQSIATTLSGTGTSFTTTGNYTNSAGTLTISPNLTLNVSGNITTNGSFFCSGTSNFDGSFTYINSVLGSGTIVMRGSGTISGATALIFFAPNLIFSGTGTITFSGIMYKSGGTITTISGVNVNTIGSTLVPLQPAMPIFNTQHMTWNNITFSGAAVQQIRILSTLNISGTTLLSNGGGVSFSGVGTFNPTGTLTLAAAISIQFPNTLNLNILNITANNTLTNSVIINTQSFSGTSNLLTNAISNPTLVFTGTGVWNSSGLIAINTIINSVETTLLGTSTFAPPTTTKTLTYSGGTVITSGNTFIVSGIPTLNTNGSSSGGATTTSSTGINFNNFNIVASTTLTLTSDLCTVSSFSGSGTVTSVANTVYIGGNLTLTGNITGTAPLVMNGTGTWSGNFSLQKNLSFNSTGTITLSGLLQYGPGTLTYTAGIINVGTSTVSIISNTTIAGSMTFYNLNIGGSPTIILNTSTPTINNTLLLSGSTNFTSTGVIGFTTTNFSSVTTSLTHILKTGTTYTVNSLLVLTGTSAGAVTLRSSNTSGSTFFNLNYGATQRVAFVTATDINSSGGQTIWDYKGTLTRTTNWNLLTTPITLAETFVY